MTRLLLRRLAAALLLLLLVLSITFVLLHLAPGDPTALLQDSRIPQAQRERLRHVYGLDRPLHEQYFTWLRAVTLEGDWGVSLVQQRPVTTLILEALPNTLILAAAALGLDYALGFLLGVAAARRPGSLADHLIRFFSLLLFSLPLFWLGLMAVLLFSYVWPILPPSHLHSVGAEQLGPVARFFDLLRHLILPVCVLSLASAGGTARFVRNSLLETMGQDYIRTARAKGLSERRVVWVHGVRNALVPILQLFALSFPALLNGSLVTEVVFSWPGMGSLTFNAILTRDYPLILASTALSGIMVVLGNLIADLLHGVVDPRVREA
jgi:peptide/nickel transport system permease protein